MKKYIPGLLIVGFLLGTAYSTLHAQTVLFPYQGGTGISSATSSDVGKALIVSSTSPFTYAFGTAGGGASATTTIYATATSTGPAFTFATSSDTNLGIVISCSGSTCTWTPVWIGQLDISSRTNLGGTSPIVVSGDNVTCPDCIATTTGNWLGTFDGQEGTYYLARANHTGTQTAATISDFNSTARGLFSATAPISYNSTTGDFTLTGRLSTINGFATTTGGMIVGSGSDWALLPVGTNGKALVASSTAANGLSWETITSSGGTLNGSGTSTQIAFWNGTSSLTSDPDYVWNASTNTLTFDNFGTIRHAPSADGFGGFSIGTANQTNTNVSSDELEIFTGAGNGSGSGADFYIYTGQGGSTGNGGNLYLGASKGQGGGTNGAIHLQNRLTAPFRSAILDTASIATSNKTFTFPNQTGTFCLTSTCLVPANNLSDLSSTSTARTNLGLTDTATLASSTWLKVLNNLSDLQSTSTARTNLGLGTGDSPAFTGLTLSGLTSGRIPYTTTGGLLTNSSGLTYNGTTFSSGVLTGLTASSITFASSPVDTGGALFLPTYLPSTTANATVNNWLYDANVTKKVASGVTDLGRIVGMRFSVLRNFLTTGDSGTLASLQGMIFQHGHFNSDVTATPITTDTFGLQVSLGSLTGTIATASDIRIGGNSSAGTVTTHTGLEIGALLGTTVRGISSAVASGSGKHNLYISGTADNYLQGRTGVGTTTPQSAFQVWNTASTTARIGDTNSIGCLTMGDSDGSGVTYVTANNGVLSATTTKPTYCQ